MNPFNAVRLKAGSLTLNGFSRSGLATWLAVPQLDVLFDIGECPLDVVRSTNVLVTHGHDDHIRCLTRHMAMRGLLHLSQALYFVPAEIYHLVVEMIRIDVKLGNLPTDCARHVKYLVQVATVGERLSLQGHHDWSRFWTVPFAVDHRVPSVGYTIFGKRKRLLPEWRGLPGSVIGEARKAGKAIDEEYEVAHLTFIGDHMATALDLDHIWDSNVLVVEATFLDGDEEGARQKGHTHISELVARLAKRTPKDGQSLVLKHFSMRHSDDQIRESIELLPEPWRLHTQLLF